MNLNTWAVVIRGDDYDIRQLEDGELMPPDVIAFHPTQESARLGLERIEAYQMAVSQRLREPCARETATRRSMAAVEGGDKHPDILNKYITPSLEHETLVRNSYLTGLLTIAQPRSKS